MEGSAHRDRPSIAERAARRQELQRSERDRYANLVRALQAGREIPLRPRRGERLEWHPVAWLLVRLALLGVLVYAVVSVSYNFWRNQQVDAWTGPDASVTSGQRLAGCGPANSQGHEYLPTWVRFHDRVYVLTPRQQPLRGGGLPNETGHIETGYSLERLRIMIPSQLPSDEPAPYIYVVQSGSLAAAIYNFEPTCA